MQVDVGEEQLVTGQRDIVRDADIADVATRAGSPDGLHHRLLGPDRLDYRVRTEPTGEVFDPGDAILTAFGHDVGGTKLSGERLPRLMPAHRNDPLRAQLLGGEYAEQPNGAVSNDGDGLARASLGGDRAEPAGAQHVGS
jgi:hypothetical protein